MPMKAPRICVCGLKIASDAVCICRQANRAAADRRRPSAHARGYDSRWQKARTTYLASHPRCVMVVNGTICGQQAKIVDHIIAHRGNQTLFWDSKGNWQSLCINCHSSRKQSLERRDR